jgi:hypothetical protein
MNIGRATLTPIAALAIVIVLGEWSGLARAILDVPAYAALLDVVVVAVALLTVWRAVRHRETIRLHPLDWLVAAFFVLAAIQILNPNVPSPLVGLEGFRKTAFTMLAYPIVRFARRSDGLPFYRIIAIGSVPAFLWSIRQSVSPLPIELEIISSSGVSEISFHSGPVLRAFAPTAGPFHLGILGAAVAVISSVAARRSSRWFIGIAVLAAIALGVSLTRANQLAAVAAFGAIILASAPTRERIRTLARFTPVVAALGLAIFVTARSVVPTTPPIEPGGPAGPVGSLEPGEPNPLPNPLEDRSLRFRFEYWAEHVGAISERPLIGYGTSSAGDGFDRHYRGTGSENFNSHSLYLKAALELGLIGLALILAILGLAVLECRRAYRRHPEVALIAFGLLTITGISGFAGPMLDAYPFNLLLWATIGWLVASGTAAASAPDEALEQPLVVGGDALP